MYSKYNIQSFTESHIYKEAEKMMKMSKSILQRAKRAATIQKL